MELSLLTLLEKQIEQIIYVCMGKMYFSVKAILASKLGNEQTLSWQDFSFFVYGSKKL